MTASTPKPALTTCRDEDGAVAVIVAITLTVLVLMAAFVIDLGLARIDSARSQSTADMAAAAGANTLDVLDSTWNGAEACEAALSFARRNLNLDSAPVPIDGRDCQQQFASVSQCSALTIIEPARYRAGQHVIEISAPVPDGSPLMLQQPTAPDFDGDPCERLGVTISTERDYLLAGVGTDLTGGTVTRSAVGRVYAQGDDSTFASLIVLHPSACQVLVAQNVGSRIQVGSAEVDGERYPGAITIYSNPGTGCTSNNNKVIRASSSGSIIEADGLILSYGAGQGAASPGQIYQQGDLDAGRLSPAPRSGPPITRSEIDHDYNCMADYPTSGPNWRPNRAGLTWSDCDVDEGPNQPYIKRLADAYQSLTASNVGAGWTVFPDDFAAQGLTCNSAQFPAAGLEGIATADRWFINCNGSNGPSTFRPNGFNLVGVTDVVFSGPIRMTGGSSALSIVGPDPSGAIVYLQNGDIERNQGNLVLENTLVYLDDGRLELAGTAGAVTMTPPRVGGSPSNCSSYSGVGAPPADCFARLSMWSNKAGLGNNDGNQMGGGSTMFVRGILFSPNNAFEITGSGDDVALSCDPADPVPSGQKLNLRNAQFWASRVTVGGNGVVTLCPSPEDAKETFFPGSSLIRGSP